LHQTPSSIDIAPTGHILTHAPHSTHFGSSMQMRASLSCMAPAGQTIGQPAQQRHFAGLFFAGISGT
jgi:hypothetical protein